MTAPVPSSPGVTLRVAIAVIASIWGAGLALALGLPYISVLRGVLGPDTAVGAVDEIGMLFAPYVGVVLGYLFRDRQAPVPARFRRVSRGVVLTAVLTSLAWNVAVVTTLVLPLFGAEYGFQQGLTMSAKLSAYLSWLVAPALGYFFGYPETAAAALPERQG